MRRDRRQQYSSRQYRRGIEVEDMKWNNMTWHDMKGEYIWGVNGLYWQTNGQEKINVAGEKIKLNKKVKLVAGKNCK